MAVFPISISVFLMQRHLLVDCDFRSLNHMLDSGQVNIVHTVLNMDALPIEFMELANLCTCLICCDIKTRATPISGFH